MKRMNSLLNGLFSIAVVKVESCDLNDIAVDQRVLLVRELIMNNQIVLCELNLEEFLYEEESPEYRKVKIDVAKDLGMKNWLLADNIEDIVLVECLEHCIKIKKNYYSDVSMVFFPKRVFKSFNRKQDYCSDDIYVCKFSSAWRKRLMKSNSIINKYEKELINWPYMEMKDFDEKTIEQNAEMAKLLGYDNYAEEKRQVYDVKITGKKIGSSVGKMHNVHWLGTDYSLSNFYITKDSAMRMDTANDVMLLRSADLEDLIASIIPLYNEMNYTMWQGFREGYLDFFGVKALPVLEAFDKDKASLIAASYFIGKCVKQRKAHDYEIALQCCDDAEVSFKRYSKFNSSLLEGHLLQTDLVRGDVYVCMGEYDKSEEVYKKALAGFQAQLKAGNKQSFFSYCSGQVNLANVFYYKNEIDKAIKLLHEAKKIALEYHEVNPEEADFLIKTADQNLEKWKNKTESLAND